MLLISLFFPWFGVNFGFGSITVDGPWHGWTHIVLFVSLAVLIYLGAEAGFSEMPVKMPLAKEQRLLLATGLNAVLVMLAFLFKPGGVGSAVGWRFGALVGLISAIAAVTPLAAPVIRERRVTRN